MRKVISFDRGSKKKLQMIRWTRSEIVSAVLLGCIVMAVWFEVLMWFLSHESDKPDTPPSLVIRR